MVLDFLLNMDSLKQENIDEKLEKLLENTSKERGRIHYSCSVKKPLYVPSHLKEKSQINDLYELIEDIYNEKGGGVFLDLGSGAGCMTIMASLIGFDSYGIELNSGLFDFSKTVASGVEADSASFVLGDCFKDESYEEAGIGVKDVDVHYIYPSNKECLSKTFERMADAKKDSLLLTGYTGFNREVGKRVYLEEEKTYSLSRLNIIRYRKKG